MSKHLQGPLQVGYEFDETGYPLFVVAGLSGDQKRDRDTLEATAKVFAAAPELLEALGNLWAASVGTSDEEITARLQARLLIQRVTGETVPSSK